MNRRYGVLSCMLAFSLLAGAWPVQEAAAAQDGERVNIGTQMEKTEKTGSFINDLYTDKSMYNPGETIRVTVDLKGMEGLGEGVLRLQARHLTDTVWQQEIGVSSASPLVQVHVTLPEHDFTGYSLEAYLWEGDTLRDYAMSAVDVSSDWNVFPRYGYITKLDNRTDEEIGETLERLKRHHINGLFYYDVFDTQEHPLAGTAQAPKDSWKSLAGQTVTRQSLLKTIQAGHDLNMKSFFYNLIFGAYDGYQEKGISPEWGLYRDARHTDQDVHDLSGAGWETEKLWMFNPADTNWQNHFVESHRELLEAYPFDGLQLDSLGNRNESRYDYSGREIQLDQTYASFLKRVDEELDTRILFNPVGGYGLTQMLNSGCYDMAYMEVWPGDCKDYLSLKKSLDQIYAATKGNKGSVIAAYMNYNVMKGEPFNLPGILYTNAVLTASGGSHLELGDTGMLSNEYYPGNSLRISRELAKRLRTGYSFMTAYENCLRGPGLEEKTGIRTFVEGVPASSDAAPGSIFAFTKKKGDTSILHLINFEGASTSAWVDSRGTQTAPVIKREVTVVQPVDRQPEKIWFASPDYQQGILKEVEFVYKDGTVTFDLPYLEYWDMVVIE
ncbi:hypothetical protein GPL15_01860 [Clostridium sp. MCC353]|uniref:glycoside hydrolase family 66 protein n=1 Tax=Clostridium sp. MCC353 TaxID=2592646 RepID=UPI001C033C88|nr:glycoside hydrolase family 66 protein [Clostridium sp. MCC353]MBT9775253.1 hypothetical protein [Clostridium sp. MCC353]